MWDILPACSSVPRETPRQNRDLQCSIYVSVGRLTAPGISCVENPWTFTDPSRSPPFPQSYNPTRPRALWFARGDQLPLRQLHSTQVKPFPDPALIPASSPPCPSTLAPQTSCLSAIPESCRWRLTPSTVPPSRHFTPPQSALRGYHEPEKSADPLTIRHGPTPITNAPVSPC